MHCQITTSHQWQKFRTPNRKKQQDFFFFSQIGVLDILLSVLLNLINLKNGHMHHIGKAGGAEIEAALLSRTLLNDQ